MTRKRFLLINQKVEHGPQTIKIGFRRDILKVIDKLRVHTCDTVILEDVISLLYMSTLSLSGIKHLVIRNAGLLSHASIYGVDDLEILEIYGSICYLVFGVTPRFLSHASYVSILPEIMLAEDMITVID